MTRGLFAALIAGGVLWVSPPAQACAGCSNPNLPTARGHAEQSRAGQLSVTLNFAATTMRVVHSEHCPDIGPICAERDEPPQLHDQRFWVGELRPLLDYAFTEHFGVEAQLPFRYTNTSIVFRRLNGDAFEPDYLNIHHRNETLTGIGDPWLSARGSWTLASVQLNARAGVALPLGRTEENPFALGENGQPHQHVQFGTGTFSPVVSVDARLPLGTVDLNAYGQTQLFLYENGLGYRAGDRFSGGLSVAPKLGLPVGLAVGADVVNEQPERWDGRIQQDGNVGRTDVLVGGSVDYAFGEITTSLNVRVPVWQHFIRAGHLHEGDPGQLTYPAVVNVAVGRRF